MSSPGAPPPSHSAQADAAAAARAISGVLAARAVQAAKQQRRIEYAAAAAKRARRRKHSSDEEDDEEEELASDSDESATAAAASSAPRASKAARLESHSEKVDPLALIRQTKQAQAQAAAEAMHHASTIAAASSRGATALPASAASSAAAAVSASDDAVWPLELSHAAVGGVRSEIDDVDWEADAPAAASASARPSLLHQSSLSTQQATQPLDEDLELADEAGAAASGFDGVDRAAWADQNEEVLFGGDDDDDDPDGSGEGAVARFQAQQLAQIDAEERASKAAAADAAARRAAADDPMLLNKVVLKAASAPASAHPSAAARATASAVSVSAAAAAGGGALEISFEAQSADQLEQQVKDHNLARRLQKATKAAAAAASTPASAAGKKPGTKGRKRKSDAAEPDIIVPPAGSSPTAAASAKRARSSNEVDALFGPMSDEDDAAADASEPDDDDAAAGKASASTGRKGKSTSRSSAASSKRKSLPILPSQRMTKDNKELVLAVHRVHVLSMLFLWRQYSSPLRAQSIMGDERLLALLLSVAINKVPHLRSKGFTLDPRKPAVWVGAKRKSGGGGSASAGTQGLKWKMSHGAGSSAAAASSSAAAAAAASPRSSSPDEIPPASEGTVFDRVQKLAYWFRGYFRCHGDRIRLPLSDKKHPLHAFDPRLHSRMHNMLRCTCIRQRIIHTGVTRGALPNRWVHYKSCIVSQLSHVLSTREGGFEHLTMLFCMLLRQSHVLARMCYGFTPVSYREGIVFPTKTAAAAAAQEAERHAAGAEMLDEVFGQFGVGAQFGSEGGGSFAQMLRAQSLPSHYASSAAAAASSTGVPPSSQALLVLHSAKQEKCPCKAPFKPVVYMSVDEMVAEEKATKAAAAATPAPAAAAASSPSSAAAAAASPSKPSPHFPVPSPPFHPQQPRKKESFLSAAAAGAIEILDDSDDDLMEVTMTKASPQSKSPAAVRGALGALASEAGNPAAGATSAATSPTKAASAPSSSAAAGAAASASSATPAAAAAPSPASSRAAKSKPVNYAEPEDDDDEDEAASEAEEGNEEEQAAPKPKRSASAGKAKAKAAVSAKKNSKRAGTKAAAVASPGDDSNEIEDVTPAASRKKPAARKKKAESAAAVAANSPEAAGVDLTLPESPPLRGLAGVGVLAKAKPRRSRSTQAADDASFDAATAEAARAASAAAAAEFEIDSDLDRPPSAAASGFSSTTSAAASKRAQKQYFEHGYPLVWIEFYSPEERRWIHLDLLRELFDSPFVYEHDGGLSLEYVIAVRPSIEGRQPLLSDVTKRYTNQWNKIQLLRLDESWFTAELARLSGPCAPLDRDIENSDSADLAALHSASESAMPTSLSGFKSHPQWCLEMHCGKFEAIYPKGPEHSRGVFVEKRRAKGDEQPAANVNHLIYPRSSLHTLHTIDRWRREQRAVKDSEIPYPVKSVKRNAHMSKEAAARKAALGLIPPGGERSELYGIWQTEAWMPAAAAGDGLVPKNARGHVDVWGASHVPGGCVHLKLADQEGSFGSLSRAARKLGVDYAKAMVGFDVARHGSVPRFEGIVVLAEHADAVRAMAREMEAAAIERAEKKRMAKINDGWRRLVKGNIVRMRLLQQIGDDGQAVMPAPAGSAAAAGVASGVGAAAHLSNTAYGSIAIAGRAAAAGAGSSGPSASVVVPAADHVHSFDAKTFDPDRNEWSAMCRCGARQTFEEI